MTPVAAVFRAASDRTSQGLLVVISQSVFQLNGSTRQSETFIRTNILGEPVLAANSFLWFDH